MEETGFEVLQALLSELQNTQRRVMQLTEEVAQGALLTTSRSSQPQSQEPELRTAFTLGRLSKVQYGMLAAVVFDYGESTDEAEWYAKDARSIAQMLWGDDATRRIWPIYREFHKGEALLGSEVQEQRPRNAAGRTIMVSRRLGDFLKRQYEATYGDWDGAPLAIRVAGRGALPPASSRTGGARKAAPVQLRHKP